MKVKLFSKIGNAVTSTVIRTKMKIGKASPEILLVVGIGSGVAACVMACKATLKADEIIEQHKKEIEKIHEAASYNNAQYGETEKGRDLFNEAVKNAVRWMRLYAPSVALGGLAVTCILCSYGILKKRNVALTAAYTALEGVFKDYRSRVVDKFGEKVDQELFYGVEEEEIEVEDKKTGKIKKERVLRADNPEDLAGSPYAVIFGPGNPNFNERDDDANKTFLRAMQNHWNDKLQSRPHVPIMYSSVLDDMGFVNPKKEALQSGWIVGNGDGYIDLRIKKIYGSASKNCFYYLLDPNVDGYILDKI